MPEEVADARRAAAVAARRLATLLVTSACPADELSTVADELGRLAERLTPWSVGSRYALPVSCNDSSSLYMETHPLLGQASPMAPPLVSEPSGNGSVVTGVFDARYEGPPGLVHAGMVTFGFEFALGVAAASSGSRAFSVSTTIRYRKPLRVGSAVRFEAEIDRIDGRKVFTKGALFAQGELHAEATGVHVTVDDATWNAARTP